MRVESKEYYYFEEIDKGLFTDFLWQSHTSMKDFAELCGVSLSYLSLIINGKRAITNDMIDIFAKNGFELKM